MISPISAPAFDDVGENFIGKEFTSLLDEVDSEEIAARYDNGLHSKRIDFLKHVKIGLRLGIADPDTLENLAQQTDVYAGLEPISKSHFSKLTTRRPAQRSSNWRPLFLSIPLYTTRACHRTLHTLQSV